MIETHGFATVAIGLVRPQIEKTKPPRGLWVPFPLGRPLGEPEDPPFQHRVLSHALNLFERDSGPVILEDFPDDAPSMRDTAGWAAQVVLPNAALPSATDKESWVKGIAAELVSVTPLWQAARRRFGRTTVGLSRIKPEDWAPFAARFVSGEIPQSPVEGFSPALAMRFVADDLKAFYMEAAQAVGAKPSPGQIERWFWYETLAADLLRGVRAAALSSENSGFKTVGSRFIVPVPFVEKLNPRGQP